MRASVCAGSLLACGAASAQASEAYVEQVGFQNEAAVTQLASNAFLLQSGMGNQAAIEQVGTGGHLVRLDQYDGSLAEVLQTGTGNRLVGLDWRTNSESVALQRDASRLVLEQHGEGNLVLLKQAAGSFAHITQNGAGNTATVIQTGP